MQTDPLGDFLTQIRNANMAGKHEMESWNSRARMGVAHVLKEEGYIQDFAKSEKDGKPSIKITLKAGKNHKAITGIKRVSRPGLRRYVGVDDIPRILGGLGISILSTSKGILSGREAKKHRIGGEIIAYVW